MRYLNTIFLMTALCCCAAAYAGNDTSYLPSIGIEKGKVVKDGRTVRLTMSVDLSGMKIRTQHTVALIPVLVAADSSREIVFPPVVIDGKVRNKVYLRAQRMESVDLPPYHIEDSVQVIIRRQNRKEQVYDYMAELPYQRWMLDGRIEIREEVHGCVNCGEGEDERPLLPAVLPTYIPDYALDTIAPEPEPIKVRAETRTARLQFRQDSYKILPGFKNNRAELDTVSSSIALVKKNTDVTITGIYVTGYASPEGSVAYNLILSENRAKALVDYIRTHDGISEDMLHVTWKGEDWEGFEEMLGRIKSLMGLDQIKDLIAAYPDDRDYCELQFQKLEPKEIYQRLLAEIYPALRRNEYRIEYNVRNFNIEEARRMVEERPDLLSLTEMYKVAGSYGKGTEGYDRVMAAAALCFPDAPAVLNDRALDAIARGEYSEAADLLERSAATYENPSLTNTLGVAYAGAGEFYKAEEAFRRASDAGSVTAGHNLAEVRQVIDQL